MNTDLSISDLAKKLRNREMSVTSLVEECYALAESTDAKTHAFVTLVDKKQVHNRIHDVERRLDQLSSPLAGIPFVMKDAYITKGVRTTAASKILDTFLPPYNATVYQRLEDAGAILIGKMNMDSWGHGASSENTDYGACRNPWDTTRSAGGSGGGPAAALATRSCIFGIGEDTGGSIRNPAAWNNITALKVTYGRVSRYGAIAYASSLDTVGPTAKTAEDCSLVLEAIAGRDPYDATSSSHQVSSYGKDVHQSIRGKRLAFPREFYGEGLDPEIRDAIFAAREVFESLGAVVEDVSLPLLEYGVPVYYILAPSETSSNLGRYDGIRYGEGRQLFTKESKRRIMTGTYALSSGYYDAYYKKAQKVRSLFIKEYAQLLSGFDAILSPVTPIMPPAFGELLNDPVKNMMADLYTVIVNIVGLPSLALPCGFGKLDLPIGMQLIGSMFSEGTLLSIGHAYQTRTDWHRRRPSL